MDQNEDRLQQSINEEPEVEWEEEQPRYVPRPMWQVWSARIGLILFILVVIMYYINMMRGGR